MKTKLPVLALAALLFAGLPLASSSAAIGISVAIAPPAIPIYEQPYCPAPGYLWTPGYWAYADFGYYWVPGVWVRPPRIGLLWTPGYWGYRGGHYIFNDGYWGPTVGFYGGINYGYGYGGRGYYGGEWSGGAFRYNTAVTRVNTSVIHNTYVNREVVNNPGSRAGFNGPGGANVKPTAQEQKAAKAQHVPPTSTQRSQVKAAQNDPGLRAANNKGQPKAEAVQEFHNKNGAKAAAEGNAVAGNNAGNKKQAGPNEQAGARKQVNTGKPKAGAASATEGRGAKAKKTADAPKVRAHKASQANQNHPMKKAAAPAHEPQRTRTTQHQPKAGKARKATAAGGQGAAGGEQNHKKKKRARQGPGGQ